jgi:predicted branched-subunit amino acid permease
VLSVTGLIKVLASQLTIDESNAVSASQDGPEDSKLGFWLTGAAVFVFWNLFTLLGALLGSVAGDPSIWGLDAAAAAAFLGLVWPRLKNLQSNLIAVLAIALTLLLVPVMPSGLPVIIGAPVAVALIYLLKRTPLAKYLQVGHDE